MGSRNKIGQAVGAALVCAAVALGGAAGCGSGGGAPSDGGVRFDTGVTAGLGTMTWKDNGAARSATFATAALARNASLDFLLISGADATATGISFGVATRTLPIAAGSYACGGTSYPIVSFTYGGTDAQQPPTCTIVLGQVGTTTGSHAVGTFTATLAVSGGGSKALTEGHFDLPETVASQ